MVCRDVMGMVIALERYLPHRCDQPKQKSSARQCRRDRRNLCFINFRRRISIRSNARAAREDCCAITTAPIRRVMMPGPGAKRKKIPAAATKMPPAMSNAFRTGPLLNCCRYLNCCWNRRPGMPALKRRQLCFRCFSMDVPQLNN